MGAASTPPGWYPDVERPGGERYWDGIAWTEQRRGGEPAPFGDQAAGYQQPGYQQPGYQQPGYQQPGYQQPGYQQPGSVPPAYGAPAYGSPVGYQPYGSAGSAYPKSAVSGWALGLSIAGLVLGCCGGFVLSIPGTIMGWSQMKAIDRGEKDPGSRGTAKAAFIVGIIGLSVGVLFVLYFIAIVASGA